MRKSDDIERAIDTFGSTVWRVCVTFFRHSHDAQDAFQETFLKYALAEETDFQDDEHCKAWLIKVSANVCRDMLRAAHRKDHSFDQETESPCCEFSVDEDPKESRHLEIVEAFRSLDDPPRLPLFLSLYEGYTAPEIAEIVDAPVNTVYSWIARGKKMLKEALS